MIRVTAFVTAGGQIDFGFQPEAKSWVLHGVSLAKIESAVRFAISDRMPHAEAPDAALAMKVSRIAQDVIDEMVAKGLIGEG
jgi:hypothetical protein